MVDLNLDMFKAYDIRTPAEQLTLELAERLARAEARYFSEVLGVKKVVLARDARLSGPAYLEQGIRIFREAGLDVIANPQVSSTCLFYYSCMRNPDAAGIMYGASHNPGKDSGQKIVGPGLQPIAMGCGPAGGLVEIRRLYERAEGPRTSGKGSLTLRSYLEEYLADSLALAGVEKGSLQGGRILIDFLSGAAGTEFTQAFTHAGADITVRNLVPDGRFPAGAPNPVVSQSVAPSVAELKRGGFDFAIFFDGDGDRIDFIYPDGRQVSPGFNFSALAPRLRESYADAFGGSASSYRPQVYADLKANPLAIVRIARQGFGVHVIRNGHSQIKEALRANWQNQFVAAVEESAHYYLNARSGGQAFPTENTLFYGLLTARTWLADPAQYRELQELQYATFREREWGYMFPNDAARAKALEGVEKAFEKMGGESMSRMADGMDLEATLMRQGLPFIIDAETPVTAQWTQVAQRISQSEKGLARWEVSAGTAERKEEAVALIDRIARDCGAGPRYVG